MNQIDRYLARLILVPLVGALWRAAMLILDRKRTLRRRRRLTRAPAPSLPAAAAAVAAFRCPTRLHPCFPANPLAQC